MSRRNSFSIFALAADHGTNVAYFLGAVVPLFALGIVIERYFLAPLQPGTEQALSLGRPATLGLFISIATLSFACFLVLRRIVRSTIE
jgi:hypothetical protein